MLVGELVDGSLHGSGRREKMTGISGLAVIGAVPLVAKTYGTNVQESRILLEKVLELMREDNFPIDFLTRLAEHIDRIWDLDPECVALIYHAIFSHNETSDERTRIGGNIYSFRKYASSGL